METAIQLLSAFSVYTSPEVSSSGLGSLSLKFLYMEREQAGLLYERRHFALICLAHQIFIFPIMLIRCGFSAA